jgi:hypothetical protein
MMPAAPDLSQPVGLHCPACQVLASIVINGGRAALCSNLDCRILLWDPAMTLADLMAGPIDWMRDE